ncbi:SDR family oxidoreductase [Phytohabitans sp. LJ34]|uniref:SDR family oxidoreductase n=1 Tax=Phytohabitans sp. LJ34 TaxID=3452217 RepID=UPI003F8CD118
MIALTGATGTVGQALVKELAAAGLRPRLLVRGRSVRLGAVAGLGDPVPIDLSRPQTMPTALAGVRRLFLLTPFSPQQDEWQVSLVEAAARAGVTHVVKLSSLGADESADALVQRQHGRGDRALADSGLRHVVLRPNAFAQNAAQWLGTVAERDAIVMPTGDARVSMIDARDIAAVAARLLIWPPKDQAARFDLTGPHALSYAEMAEHLSKVAGRTIRHLDVRPEEAERAMLAAGQPEWAVRARLELYGTYRAGQAEVVTTAVRDLTGRPPRTFDVVAEELADRLRRP